MDRIACVECRQCNHKGKPSVSRFSPYCNRHYKHAIKTKKSIFGFFNDIKDKIFDKRVDEKGQIKTTKGFRKSWFYR